MSNPAVLSLYGNVAIKRGFCPSCESMAFVIDEKLQCCDAPFTEAAEKIRREFEPVYRRKTPPTKDRRRILAEQDYRCIYCEQAFGATRFRSGKPVLLKLNWDHSIPYTYNADNRAINFVAACHVCNGLKGDLIFRDLEDARLHLSNKRKEKNYDW